LLYIDPNGVFNQDIDDVLKNLSGRLLFWCSAQKTLAITFQKPDNDSQSD